MTWDSVALEHGTDKASAYGDHRGHSYMAHYERLLSGMQIGTLLEIGVHQGRSLRLWQDLLPAARIIGIDIDPACASLGFEVVIADQADEAAMTAIGEELGPFDVIIDDGSHEPADVEASHRALWPHVAKGGWYFIEDLPRSQALTLDLSAIALMLYPSTWPDDQDRVLITRRKI